MTRAVSTLLGAAGAGALVWVAARVDNDTNGRYWAQIAILAAAGMVLAAARTVVSGGTAQPSRATFSLAFLPSLVAGGWVIVAAQPHANTVRGHVLNWSSDIHVSGVVRDLGPYVTVLALGVGLVLGFAATEARAVATVVGKPVREVPLDSDVPLDGETPTLVSDADPIPH